MSKRPPPTRTWEPSPPVNAVIDAPGHAAPGDNVLGDPPELESRGSSKTEADESSDHDSTESDSTEPEPAESSKTELDDAPKMIELPRLPLPERDRARYEVIEEHGRGGFGRVLRVKDLEFGRDVAIKELLHRTPRSEARFVREAVITSRLEHPNIVPVHEAGQWEGTPYYTMKLVSGRSLAELIDEAKTWADRRALLDRVVAVADGVAFAHDRGVIHRDLKPGNVVVGEYGETIVIDWGLAKYLKEVGDSEPAEGERPPVDQTDPVRGNVTVAGGAVGTPAYMAPEQAYGGVVTRRSDVFSLGAILLDVLAGRGPTATRDERAGQTRVTREAGPSDGSAFARPVDPKTPSDLRSIVQRAMALDPWKRYATAKEFADDLRRFLATSPVAAHRYTRRQRSARWLAAHRRFVQGAGAVLVALLAASVWFLARESRLRNDAEVARKAADQSRVAADRARLSAESERDRADRQTLALLEQQARTEMAAGHPFRAAPFLAEAYRRDPKNMRIKWMLTDALRALDSLTMVINTTRPTTPSDKVGGTYSVSLSMDETELVTGHQRSVRFWDATTGKLRRQLLLPFYGIRAAHHHKDSSRLLLRARSRDHGGSFLPVILDASTGRELIRMTLEADMWGEWSVDGRYLASINQAGLVNLWSLAGAGKRLFSFQGAPLPVGRGEAISPDGSIVAIRGRSEAILASSATGALRRLRSPGEDIYDMSFSNDSQSLLTVMSDQSVRIWDVATGELFRRLPSYSNGLLFALFSNDRSSIATADSSSLRLWDIQSTALIANLDSLSREPIHFALFAHRSSRLLTVNGSGPVQVWNLPNDRWARPLRGHRGRVVGKYLAGGTQIVTVDEGADRGGRLRVWNARDGEVIRSSTIEWEPDCDVAVSKDGTRIAFLGRDGNVRISDVETGDAKLVIDTRDKLTRDLAFSPDSHQLATVSEAGTLRLWSLDDGRPASIVFRGSDKGKMQSVAFKPDGGQIVTGSLPGQVHIWDSSTGQLLWEVPAGGTHAAAYSPDGRRIVIGGGFRRATSVWDSASRTQLSQLEIGSIVFTAGFSPDSMLVAATHESGRITIADAATGIELRSIDGPANSGSGFVATVLAPRAVEFSPDGKRLLATGNGYALIWNVELDQRPPAEVDALVAAKSPWRLVDGRLTRVPLKMK